MKPENLGAIKILVKWMNLFDYVDVFCIRINTGDLLKESRAM